jgi:pantetheine-phosphate adenylyltransferase
MAGKLAICPGTFDPVTYGHLDVILRAAEHFDRVIVAVAINPDKKPLFSTEERVDMVAESLSEHDNIRVVSFDCLLIDLAHEYNAFAIVKGLRAMSDFEFEFQMAQFNRKMDERVETFFVMASPEYTYLSSSGIKEVLSYGGCISGLVPEMVEERILKKFGRGRKTGKG